MTSQKISSCIYQHKFEHSPIILFILVVIKTVLNNKSKETKQFVLNHAYNVICFLEINCANNFLIMIVSSEDLVIKIREIQLTIKSTRNKLSHYLLINNNLSFSFCCKNQVLLLCTKQVGHCVRYNLQRLQYYLSLPFIEETKQIIFVFSSDKHLVFITAK